MTAPFKTPALALALAAVGLGGACTSLSAASQGDKPLSCALVTSKSRHGTTLEARATAHAPVTGSYALDIEQRGTGGHAVIRQGGDFELRAGQTQTLGEVTLGGDPAGYDATLSLRWNGDSVACSSDGSSDI